MNYLPKFYKYSKNNILVCVFSGFSLSNCALVVPFLPSYSGTPEAFQDELFLRTSSVKGPMKDLRPFYSSIIYQERAFLGQVSEDFLNDSLALSEALGRIGPHKDIPELPERSYFEKNKSDYVVSNVLLPKDVLTRAVPRKIFSRAWGPEEELPVTPKFLAKKSTPFSPLEDGVCSAPGYAGKTKASDVLGMNLPSEENFEVSSIEFTSKTFYAQYLGADNQFQLIVQCVKAIKGDETFIWPYLASLEKGTLTDALSRSAVLRDKLLFQPSGSLLTVQAPVASQEETLRKRSRLHLTHSVYTQDGAGSGRTYQYFRSAGRRSDQNPLFYSRLLSAQKSPSHIQQGFFSFQSRLNRSSVNRIQNRTETGCYLQPTSSEEEWFSDVFPNSLEVPVESRNWTEEFSVEARHFSGRKASLETDKDFLQTGIHHIDGKNIKGYLIDLAPQSSLDGVNEICEQAF